MKYLFSLALGVLFILPVQVLADFTLEFTVRANADRAAADCGGSITDIQRYTFGATYVVTCPGNAPVEQPTPTVNPPVEQPTPTVNPPVEQPTPSPSTKFVSITNPLPNKSLMQFILDILSVILVFAVPLIVFFIILAGFRYVLAQGKPEEIGKASKALLYAIIGGVIILGANIILAVIQGTVDAFIS